MRPEGELVTVTLERGEVAWLRLTLEAWLELGALISRDPSDEQTIVHKLREALK